MLVLSRKQNERIRVGDSVVVTIVRVSGDKVRIGIEAPPHVRVLRDELTPEDSARHDLGATVVLADAADVAESTLVGALKGAVDLRRTAAAADRLLGVAG